MKRASQILSVAVVAAALTLQCFSLNAQDGAAQDNNQPNRRPGGGQGGPGNFDPEQARQRMMERYREQLGIKDESEWKLIETRITKINEARRDVGFRGMGFGGFGGRGGPGGGGPGGAGGGGGRRGGFGGEPSPEQESLQKAIESNASADEIKTKLTAYRTSLKDKEAKLEKAQDELRKVLSVKQEAQAVLMGLLK
jgi:hypothetical protein